MHTYGLIRKVANELKMGCSHKIQQSQEKKQKIILYLCFDLLKTKMKCFMLLTLSYAAQQPTFFVAVTSSLLTLIVSP